MLKDHGVMVVSVPWVNPLRRLKQTLKLYRRMLNPNLEFYRYVLPFKEGRIMLERCGFKLLLSLIHI